MGVGGYLIQQRILPQTEDHHEAAIPRSERGEEVLSRAEEEEICDRRSGESAASEVLHEQNRAVPRYLLALGADLDGVGNELGGLLLGHARHVFQLDGDLDREPA